MTKPARQLGKESPCPMFEQWLAMVDEAIHRPSSEPIKGDRENTVIDTNQDYLAHESHSLGNEIV